MSTPFVICIVGPTASGKSALALDLAERFDTEMEMATHSSLLAWEIPWTEEPGGLQSMGSQESDMRVTNTHVRFYVFTEVQ